MANSLAPVLKQKFWTNNGQPAAGYKVFTYAAGTDTKLDTYQSVNGAANLNPITLDFRGEANIWVPPNVAYKFVYSPPNDTDPPTAPIWTIDNVVDSQLVTLWGGVDTGIANAYVLNFTANFTSYTDGIVIYWIPANTNTGSSTINVNGLGPIQIRAQDGSVLLPGVIVAGQVTVVVYYNGQFRLSSISYGTGTFQATLSGMAAPTTGTVDYVVSGGFCTLTAPTQIIGTSNGTGMQMTGFPAACQPLSTPRAPSLALVFDNGVATYAACSFSASTTLSFALFRVSGSNIVPGPASFTSSGLKGVTGGWSITYKL